MLLFLVVLAFADTLSREQVRSLVARYKVNPISQQGREAGRALLRYAVESDAVKITMGPKTLPFMDEELAGDAEAVLMGAFVVGCVDAQLAEKTVNDFSYEGVLYMLTVYEQMKASDPNLRSPSLERYVQLRSTGKLKAQTAK